MYAHYINEMIDCLVSSGIIESEKRLAAQKVLNQYWTGRIAIVWQADDVREVIANKLRVELENVVLSDKTADKILQFVLDNHDCNLGITWDNITWAVEEELQNLTTFHRNEAEFQSLE